MRFKSPAGPAVLTFLVPILALLAPIRASPSPGSREIDPFDAFVTSPSGGTEIIIGEDLPVSLYIIPRQTPPPWDFTAGLWYPEEKKAYLMKDVSFGTGEVSFDLQLPNEIPLGTCQVYLIYWDTGLNILKEVRSDNLTC